MQSAQVEIEAPFYNYCNYHHLNTSKMAYRKCGRPLETSRRSARNRKRQPGNSSGSRTLWTALSPHTLTKVSDLNSAITHKAYIEQLLEVEVEKWVERRDNFVLEQDGALGHGGGPKARKNNPVAMWFKKHHIEKFFNCHDSPDQHLLKHVGIPLRNFRKNGLIEISKHCGNCLKWDGKR